jgi:glycosyltransferase involved in cell wall biosynthesis
MQAADRSRRDGMLVALDARIPHGQWGGVQRVVEGLAAGLGGMDGPEEFVFLTERGGSEWLGPWLGANSRVVETSPGYGRTSPRRAYDAVTCRLPLVARAARGAASRLGRVALPLPKSNGFVEGLGVDLVHFTTPQAYRTVLPSVYQPHDLLHRHYPEQFSPVHVRYREHAYRTFSERASIVSVMTEFGRQDVLEAWGLPADRVAVVPWAPVAGTHGGSASGPGTPKLPPGIPDRYIVYPGQTWPHKNHLRLIEALAELRQRGTTIPLVSTGRPTEYMGVIRRRVEELGLGSQVSFVGYLAPAELDAVLAHSTALVFPSLFEGWGLPVVEAFSLGIPVACSNAAALPEVAGGAALLFDPENTDAIAGAVLRLWEDEALREDLRRRGRARAAELSWNKTARTFRSIYRLVAGRTLTDEDRVLLGPPTFLLMPKAAG